MNANYFDFDMRQNKNRCYCKDSNCGRRPGRGIISGETICAGNIKVSHNFQNK